MRDTQFAHLRPLGEAKTALAEASSRIAAKGLKFRLELHLLDAADAAARPAHAAGEGRKLRVITRSETWNAIAEGHLSPYVAFTSGKLRFRGSMDDALEAIRALRAPGGRIALCVED